MEGGGLRNGTSCIAGAAHAQVDEALEIVHGLKRQLIHRVTNDKKPPGAAHAHRVTNDKKPPGAERLTHLEHVQLHNAPHKIRIRQPRGSVTRAQQKRSRAMLHLFFSGVQ